MTKTVLQNLGVLALAIIFSIVCTEINSRKSKKPVNKKTKTDTKKLDAL